MSLAVSIHIAKFNCLKIKLSREQDMNVIVLQDEKRSFKPRPEFTQRRTKILVRYKYLCSYLMEGGRYFLGTANFYVDYPKKIIISN